MAMEFLCATWCTSGLRMAIPDRTAAYSSQPRRLAKQHRVNEKRISDFLRVPLCAFVVKETLLY
jgi:hypothetical protein